VSSLNKSGDDSKKVLPEYKSVKGARLTLSNRENSAGSLIENNPVETNFLLPNATQHTRRKKSKSKRKLEPKPKRALEPKPKLESESKSNSKSNSKKVTKSKSFSNLFKKAKSKSGLPGEKLQRKNDKKMYRIEEAEPTIWTGDPELDAALTAIEKDENFLRLDDDHAKIICNFWAAREDISDFQL